MFCSKCGTQIADDSKFCYNCGSPTHLAEQKDSTENNDYFSSEPAVPPTVNNPAQQSSAADEGVCGLLGFILAFFFPLIGMILSIVGLNRKKYGGLALAGLILSLVFIVFIILATLTSDKSAAYLLLII